MPATIEPGNPRWVEWVQELLDGAESRGEKSAHAYRKAVSALKSCPIVYAHPKQLSVLKGIGPKMIDHLERKEGKYREQVGEQMPEYLAAASTSRPMKRSRAQTSTGDDDGDDMDGDDGDAGDVAALLGLLDDDDDGSGGASARGKKRTKAAGGAGAPQARQYVPRKGSGAYAIMLALYVLSPSGDPGTWATKDKITELAREYTNTPFDLPADSRNVASTSGGGGGGGARPAFIPQSGNYTAWNSIKTLTDKGYVEVENRRPKRWALTEIGYDVAEILARKQGEIAINPVPEYRRQRLLLAAGERASSAPPQPPAPPAAEAVAQLAGQRTGRSNASNGNNRIAAANAVPPLRAPLSAAAYVQPSSANSSNSNSIGFGGAEAMPSGRALASGAWMDTTRWGSTTEQRPNASSSSSFSSLPAVRAAGPSSAALSRTVSAPTYRASGAGAPPYGRRPGMPQRSSRDATPMIWSAAAPMRDSSSPPPPVEAGAATTRLSDSTTDVPYISRATPASSAAAAALRRQRLVIGSSAGGLPSSEGDKSVDTIPATTKKGDEGKDAKGKTAAASFLELELSRRSGKSGNNNKSAIMGATTTTSRRDLGSRHAPYATIIAADSSGGGSGGGNGGGGGARRSTAASDSREAELDDLLKAKAASLATGNKEKKKGKSKEEDTPLLAPSSSSLPPPSFVDPTTTNAIASGSSAYEGAAAIEVDDDDEEQEDLAPVGRESGKSRAGGCAGSRVPLANAGAGASKQQRHAASQIPSAAIGAAPPTIARNPSGRVIDSSMQELSLFNVHPLDPAKDHIRDSGYVHQPFDAQIWRAGTYEIVLLVDMREAEKGKQRGLSTSSAGDAFDGPGARDSNATVERLRKKGIKASARSLALGDMQWVARHTDIFGREHEVMLDYIVERKRLDDLCSSVKSSHYHDQKSRLKSSGITNKLLLVEAYETARYNAEYWQMIWTTKTQVQVFDGFHVHESPNFAATLDHLALMTRVVADLYQHIDLHVVPDELVERKTYLAMQQHLRKHEPHRTYVIQHKTFESINSRRGGRDLQAQWAHMVQTVRGLSAEAAVPLVQRWPTPRSFYDACAYRREAEDLARATEASQSQSQLESQTSTASAGSRGGGAKASSRKRANPAKFIVDELAEENAVRGIKGALSERLFNLMTADSY